MQPHLLDLKWNDLKLIYKITEILASEKVHNTCLFSIISLYSAVYIITIQFIKKMKTLKSVKSHENHITPQMNLFYSSHFFSDYFTSEGINNFRFMHTSWSSFCLVRIRHPEMGSERRPSKDITPTGYALACMSVPCKAASPASPRHAAPRPLLPAYTPCRLVYWPALLHWIVGLNTLSRVSVTPDIVYVLTAKPYQNMFKPDNYGFKPYDELKTSQFVNTVVTKRYRNL